MKHFPKGCWRPQLWASHPGLLRGRTLGRAQDDSESPSVVHLHEYRGLLSRATFLCTSCLREQAHTRALDLIPGMHQKPGAAF